jgi:hypothetical protein
VRRLFADYQGFLAGSIMSDNLIKLLLTKQEIEQAIYEADSYRETDARNVHKYIFLHLRSKVENKVTWEFNKNIRSVRDVLVSLDRNASSMIYMTESETKQKWQTNSLFDVFKELKPAYKQIMREYVDSLKPPKDEPSKNVVQLDKYIKPLAGTEPGAVQVDPFAVVSL